MLTYSTLREMQKRETDSAAVMAIEENFYEEVARLLEQKKAEAHQSNSLLLIREYENLRRIVQAVQAKREEKIALMALRGEREGNGLSREEKGLLRTMVQAIEQSRSAVKNVWDGELPHIPKKVRVLKEVGSYKGLDNAVYGPFTTGQELTLPADEVAWLLKSHMAELVL